MGILTADLKEGLATAVRPFDESWAVKCIWDYSATIGEPDAISISTATTENRLDFRIGFQSLGDLSLDFDPFCVAPA